MNAKLYGFTLLLMSLLAGCSTWNVADKEINPGGNPGPTPQGGSVSLLALKPVTLGYTSATVRFKVENPATSEYGVVLASDLSQVAALIAGEGNPDRRMQTGAIGGDGSVTFEIKDLHENSLYYAVAYVKDASGKASFSKDYVNFRTRFAPRNSNWQQLANFPAVRAYSFNPLFTINGKVYVGGAAQERSTDGFYYFKQVYEYDPATNIWTQKKDFPGTGRSETTVAVLNDKAYIMFGIAEGKAAYTSDAWEFDPSADTWRQLTSPPQNQAGLMGDYNLQAGGIPFTYDNRVYSLFGRGTYNKNVNQVNIYNSLYALNPAANSWEVSFPFNEQGLGNDIILAAARSNPFSFQYGDLVYFGGGLAASNYNAAGAYSRYFNSRQIWSYNVKTKALKLAATLPGTFNDCSDPNASGGRMAGFAFVVGSKAYINDCTDNQVFVMDLNNPGNIQATNLRKGNGANGNGTTGIGIGVGSKGYFGLRNADWWEFTP